MILILAVLTLTNILSCSPHVTSQSFSPPNVKRISTIWEWCECGKGLSSITMWPHYLQNQNVTIPKETNHWLKFSQDIVKVSWKCDNMAQIRNTVMSLKANQWLSLVIYNQTKQGSAKRCNKPTGRVAINIWNETNYISSIPFTSHTEGYACFKIPTLLKTSKGTLIVFSEARFPGCDDFDRTNLVYKRSQDNGKTWSKLQTLINANENDQGQCGHKLVIGNISPVQISNSSKYPNRILAPYTRNNFKLWVIHSDDDGLTWQGNREIPNVSQTEEHPDCNRNMSYFGYNIDELKAKNSIDFVRFFKFLCTMKNPFSEIKWNSKLKGPWQFIGVGPSQSLQLKSGRILVPGYHSPIRGLSEVPGTIPVSQLYNNFAKGFVLISDDFGQSWILGKQWPIGQGTNEHQLIQLDDGTIISNSRSLSTGTPQFRLQSKSFTQGQTFTESYFTEIPQPFAGCQGSTAGGQGGKVFVTSPNPKRGKSIVQYLTDALGCRLNLNGRERLSLWTSRDNGKSYRLDQIIDEGLSAQTSLQYVHNKLYLLYEQADPLPKNLGSYFENELIQNLRVLLPSRFVYRELPLASQQS